MNEVKRSGYILLLAIPALLAGESVAGETGEMQGMIRAHNEVRAALDMPGLEWSDEVAAVAQEWASYLAEKNHCKLKHRPSSGKYARRYGENIYWASALKWSDGRAEVQRISPDEVVGSWAGEAEDYRYSDNSCRPGKVCGHYTQVVWRNSTRLGCGMAICSDKGQVWVCSYDPPGNFIGEKPY